MTLPIKRSTGSETLFLVVDLFGWQEDPLAPLTDIILSSSFFREVENPPLSHFSNQKILTSRKFRCPGVQLLPGLGAARHEIP